MGNKLFIWLLSFWVSAAFAQVGMWLFYLPGQVLLVLSGRKEPTK